MPHRRRTGKNQKGKSEGCPLAFERAKGLANAPAPTAVRLRRRRRTSNNSNWTGASVSPAKCLVLGKHFQYKRNIAGKAKKFSFALRAGLVLTTRSWRPGSPPSFSRRQPAAG